MGRAGDRKAHASQMEQRDIDVEPIGNLANSVVEHRVAGDPEHLVRSGGRTHREADHLADERACQWRPVAARRRDHLDVRPAGRREVCESSTARVRGSCRPAAARRPAVVSTMPGAAGSSTAAAGSRLSPWWSWLSSTAWTGLELASTVSAGPAGFWCGVGAPAEEVTLARRVEGRVGQGLASVRRPRSAPSGRRRRVMRTSLHAPTGP